MAVNDVERQTERTAPIRCPTATIVVGIHDSAASRAALRWAAAQARLTGASLRVVHAWQISPSATAAMTFGGRYSQAAAGDARARATRWVLDTLADEGIDLRWTLDIVEGAPGAVLVSRSAGAKLLVLGTGERVGLRRAALGSINQFCLSHAALPVVAVPTTDVKNFESGPARTTLARTGAPR